MVRKIPLAAMDRIIRNAVPARVSDDAKEALRECLEQEAREIIHKADTLSKHAERNTLMREDIILGKKKL
jgi:histone H3/H4